MKKAKQIVMHCPCGNNKVLALGFCATCYTLKRQDEEYFGGHREEVLARDGRRCAVPACTTLKRGKRSIAVHHRAPGNSDPKLMITLCVACHAKVTRTQFLNQEWPSMLRTLWREQHPDGHEQTVLNFRDMRPQAKAVALFQLERDGVKHYEVGRGKQPDDDGRSFFRAHTSECTGQLPCAGQRS